MVDIRWIWLFLDTVETDRGDRMRARFVVLANGILTTPKLARIDGMEKFQGKSFHTSPNGRLSGSLRNQCSISCWSRCSTNWLSRSG